jgi:hypothetical protein
MATTAPITRYEGNTETMDVTVDRVDAADDLTTATALEVVIKDRPCTADSASGVVVLSSSDPSEIAITSQVAAQIVATVVIPTTATNPPYDRVWRLDVMFGAARRTAAHGPVTVVDL